MARKGKKTKSTKKLKSAKKTKPAKNSKKAKTASVREGAEKANKTDAAERKGGGGTVGEVAAPAANTEPAATDIQLTSFELSANVSERRFPAVDGVHDILYRRVNGNDVWKIVPKGGRWEDG